MNPFTFFFHKFYFFHEMTSQYKKVSFFAGITKVKFDKLLPMLFVLVIALNNYYIINKFTYIKYE